MNTEPILYYPKPERIERFLRSFNIALQGKHYAHAMGEHFRTVKVHTERHMEAMKEMANHEEPTITYVPREKQLRRRLGWLSRLRYNRDTIRLRKYNDEWIKNNIH